MKQAGVYYREFDLTQIVSADNNLPAGIVIVSKRGRANEIFTATTSRKFIDEYGQPDAKISFSSYCALAYLEQGNLLRCNRVVGAGATYGCLLLRQKNSSSAPELVQVGEMRGSTLVAIGSPKSFDFFDNARYYDMETQQPLGSDNINIGLFYPKGPGGYSEDLSISITSTNIGAVPDSSLRLTQQLGSGTLPAGQYHYSVTAINSAGETRPTAVKTVTTTQAGGSVYLSWSDVQGATGYKVYGRKQQSGQPLKLLAIVSGSNWIDTGEEPENADVEAPTATTIPYSKVFTVSIFDSSVSEGEPISEYTVTLTDEIDGMGRQTNISDVINNDNTEFKFLSNVPRLASNTVPWMRPLPRKSAPKGNSGRAPLDRDIMNGWDLFADEEKVYVRILINGGYADPSVQRKMISIAEKRQDCIAFLDTPSSKQQAQDAADYRRVTLNANTNRAALFAQDLLIDDVYQGRKIYVPPSGHMAALAAKTAGQAAVWYPMAGLNRGQLNVLGVRHQYDSGEREILKQAQVNYVRNFTGQGLCLFEQVTLQAKQTALSWISIRLMMDELRIAMMAFVWYSVHEINDDFLRRQIVSGLTEYLQTIQERRGIKRFLVVSDARNNSEQVVMSGRLNVEVFIVPNYPVDQIYLNAILTKNSANFEELIGTLAA